SVRRSRHGDAAAIRGCRAMKRLILVLLCLAAWPALAEEKWLDAYNRGVSAVRANNFQAGAPLLQKAIEEMPQENAAQRVRDSIFTYVPHFWLGIAKLNLGDPDGALREWKTSEDQGAIKSTPYFSQLQELIGRANSEKQRRAQVAANPAKQDANAAISRALSAQMDAVTAGGDRSDTYHAAQRKLNEAKALSAKGGLDVRAFKHASDVAEEARGLFANAADDAKKQRAARPPKSNPVQEQKPLEVVIPFDEGPRTKPVVQPPPQPTPATQTSAPPPKAEVKPKVVEPPPEESEALVAARIAVQQYRRRLLSMNMPSTAAQRLERQLTPQSDPKTIRRVVDEIAARERDLDKKASAVAPKPIEITPADPTAGELESAYRAYAAGDFASSDRILTKVLSAKPGAEAYLLRGCSRYTQAMLARDGNALLASAAADIQAALRIKPSLRLDRGMWSPKLIAFFEQVKGQ
ncbi:MAG TPA: hypothetical protein VHX14_18255, partial [Thermoanaerobaculia bacterium]|nr:hypothetical protein [Thermoanaerobaculia bacterium]